MRRHLIRKLGVALLAASVVFAGCSADISDAAGKDSGEEYVTLTVGVRDTGEAKAVAMPDGMTTLKPAVWLLRGIGPSDSTYSTFGGSVSVKDPYEADAEGKWASSTDGSFTVEKVRRGHWEFHVLGMTSDGARLVKGRAEADLAASGQDVTVTVRDLVTGDEGGSIPAGQAIVPTASWDASAATDVRLVVSGRKAQDAGWTVWYDGTLTDGTWTKSGGQDAAESTGSSLKLSVAAAAGTWYVRALLYDASDTAAPVAGMVEACCVVEGKTTSPDLALTIGKVVSDASVVVDATSLPITGAITEPEPGSLVWRPDAAGYIMLKGQGILAGAAAGTEDAYASADMTVVDNEVASAIAGGKLTVAWYKDGMEDAEGLTTDGAKATVEGGNAATIGVTVSSTAAGSAASFTYAYAPAGWDVLERRANQGQFATLYGIGDQFSDKWEDKSTAKSYDFVWDYVHKRDVTLSDGETLTARPFLQMHYTTPYGVQFSHQRALTAVMYKTTSALTKGTSYNFKMADGRYLNFTCPEAVESGVWLGYNNGNIEVYNATGLNKSSESVASISATASGTSLGNAPSMPAGTYSFVFASNWGSKVVAGKAVSFTIPSALSFGDRICGLYGAVGTASSNWKVYTVTDSGKTLSDPIAVTVSDDGAGTSLGTMPYSARVASLSFPLNSIQEVAYGWNRWKTSAIRQWLNSEAGVGAWWEAQDAFDIRPNELSTKPGFLSGFPAEFLNAIKRVEVKTFANTVNDGSSSSPTEDTTYDRVFLPSMTEVYVIEQKTEGQPFEYWKRRLGISSPQGWYDEHAMPERICYGVDNHTTPQHVRFRSAHVDGACYAWYAYSTGDVNYSGYASYALCSCPVVVL